MKKVADKEPSEKKEDNILAEPTRKKAGRPKLENRELKKRYSFTILPSLYDKAQAKASKEGKTLSELITNFLAYYIQECEYPHIMDVCFCQVKYFSYDKYTYFNT